jgi:hypothetical protein
MGPIQVVVEDGNNLVLEVTPTPDTTVILDRGIAGPVGPMGDGDVDGPASSTDNAVARFDGTTGKLIQNSVVTIADTTGNMAGVGTLGVGAITTSGSLTYGGVTLNNAVTGTGNMVLSNSPTLVTPALGTPASGVVTNLTGTASININGTVGATTATTGAFTDLSASGAVTLSGGTANGVAFLNSSKVLTTGSALTFDGTNLAATGLNGYSRIGDGTFDTNRTDGMYLRTLVNSPIQFYINNTERMRLTSTGLGIGTSSPGAKLDVSGTGNFQGLQVSGSPSLSFGANKWMTQQETGFARTYFCGPDASTYQGWEIYRATSTGTPVLHTVFNASGNLGLGVTPSAWSGFGLPVLELPSGGTIVSKGNGSTIGSNWYYASSQFRYSTAASASYYFQSGGAHSWHTAPSGTAGDAISFTQAMTLDASGNLVVGRTSVVAGVRTESSRNANANYSTTFTTATSSAQLALTDFSDVGTYATPAATLLFGAGSSGTGWAVISGLRESSQHSALTFATASGSSNPVERARIDSSGNFMVGTTSATNVPTKGFALMQNGSTGSIGIGHDNSGSGDTYANFGYNGSVIGSITQSGTTAVLYNVTSDQRLKENIQDAAPASALIDALQVRQYDWKADGNHQRYGFVAQELVTVAPEAVHQPADPEAMMAVDYSKLVPMLVKEIQSLRARVAALESI